MRTYKVFEFHNAKAHEFISVYHWSMHEAIRMANERSAAEGVDTVYTLHDFLNFHHGVPDGTEPFVCDYFCGRLEG